MMPIYLLTLASFYASKNMRLSMLILFVELNNLYDKRKSGALPPHKTKYRKFE
jgi:hypothetical protein